jgi:hypothetical protein
MIFQVCNWKNVLEARTGLEDWEACTEQLGRRVFLDQAQDLSVTSEFFYRCALTEEFGLDGEETGWAYACIRVLKNHVQILLDGCVHLGGDNEWHGVFGRPPLGPENVEIMEIRDVPARTGMKNRHE